jgi:hypothetical protein
MRSDFFNQYFCRKFIIPVPIHSIGYYLDLWIGSSGNFAWGFGSGGDLARELRQWNFTRSNAVTLQPVVLIHIVSLYKEMVQTGNITVLKAHHYQSRLPFPHSILRPTFRALHAVKPPPTSGPKLWLPFPSWLS